MVIFEEFHLRCFIWGEGSIMINGNQMYFMVITKSKNAQKYSKTWSYERDKKSIKSKKRVVMHMVMII